MLTLDSIVRIPADVMFTIVEDDAILLNTRTNRYFALDDVGALFWNLLSEGKTLRVAYEQLLGEYDVEGARLEADLLALMEQLMEHGLVELVSA